MATMKRMLVAMVGALLMAVSAVATAQYGSIVFSPNTGAGYAWGFSWDYGSRSDAKYRAMRECRDKGGAGCREVGWFQNNCGALAVTPEGGYGTGYGNTIGAAEKTARSSCRSAGNASCRISASRCATGAGPSATGFMAKASQPPKLSREDMRKVQTALAAQGTNPGPADGVYGARTRAAIQAWQSAKGYQATGVLTGEQMRMLLGAAQQATVARTGKDLYGSIAFSQEYDGSYAWSIVWNSGGREPAREKAIDVCRKEGGSNCAELGRFRNKCASLAVGDRGGAGTGGGKVIAEAERNALARCRNAGTSNCKIEVSRCTDKVFEIAGTKKAARRAQAEAERQRKAKEAEERRLAEARRKKPGDTFRDCPGCPEMVVVPSGRFEMGSTAGRADERPVHPVTIARPFAVGVHEVTFGEWDACVSDGGCGGYRPSDRDWGRGRRPVIYVSWDDAQAYVRWLSGRTGKAYRLLSEAEWEYVARAGTTTAYWWGDDIGRSRANCRGCGSRWDGEGTAPVGSFSANPFGLYDVHGNVWEWTEDCWNGSYAGAPRDGSAWTSGDCGRRVLRGGSWHLHPGLLRSASRDREATGDWSDLDGFRVARTLTP